MSKEEPLMRRRVELTPLGIKVYDAVTEAVEKIGKKKDKYETPEK